MLLHRVVVCTLFVAHQKDQFICVKHLKLKWWQFLSGSKHALSGLTTNRWGKKKFGFQRIKQIFKTQKILSQQFQKTMRVKKRKREWDSIAFSDTTNIGQMIRIDIPKWNHSSKNISWFMKNVRSYLHCSEFIWDSARIAVVASFVRVPMPKPERTIECQI